MHKLFFPHRRTSAHLRGFTLAFSGMLPVPSTPLVAPHTTERPLATVAYQHHCMTPVLGAKCQLGTKLFSLPLIIWAQAFREGG
jgi:hypothetical protein